MDGWMINPPTKPLPEIGFAEPSPRGDVDRQEGEDIPTRSNYHLGQKGKQEREESKKADHGGGGIRGGSILPRKNVTTFF